MTADPTAEKTVDDRIHWGQKGPLVPGWQFDRILPTIIEHTEDSIARYGRDRKPFFLYLALTTPHEPIAPSARTPPTDGTDAAGGKNGAAEKKPATFQLHDVVDDPKENCTFEAARPDIVARLHGLLTKYIADGRSTPGPARHNDISIRLPAFEPGGGPGAGGPQSPLSRYRRRGDPLPACGDRYDRPASSRPRNHCIRGSAPSNTDRHSALIQSMSSAP